MTEIKEATVIKELIERFDSINENVLEIYNQNVFLATQKIEGLHSIVSLQHRQISALTGEISQLRKSIDEIEGKIETILNDLKYIKSLR